MKQRGRPPAGLNGESVSEDYQPLSLRVPPETKQRLAAIAVLRGVSQWRVLHQLVAAAAQSAARAAAVRG